MFLCQCIIKFIDANVMQIDDDEKITVIDFPQMVSVSHRNAQMYVAYSDHLCDIVLFFKVTDFSFAGFLTETLNVSTSSLTKGFNICKKASNKLNSVESFSYEFAFLHVRFNLTSEKNEEQAGSESDDEGNSRPSFLSVKKTAGSLDKELAASGYTRKEQVEMDKVGQRFLQICFSCIHL
jgi:RIO kinase 2